MRLFISIFLGFVMNWTTICAQNVENINFLSQLEYDINLSDIWGYTDENGREYALVGLVNGTSIVDLADPRNPVEISFIEGGTSIWKDLKTYKNKAYVVGEYRDGLQIIDLSNLPNAVDSTQYFFWEEIIPNVGKVESCHNLYIEEATGVAYLSGCIAVNGGVIMLDLKGDLPVYLGTTPNPYSHDVYVRNDTVYSSDVFNGFLSIIDATDKQNPTIINTQRTPRQFTHNAWLSDDGNTVFTTDEVGDAPVAAYDISDLENIKLIDRFYPNNTRNTGLVPHNVHVKDDFLVTSYYAEGVVITDASRPNNLVQVGQYDTYLGPNSGFNGAWGVFPFFESGIIIVSDQTNGLFVLQPTYQRASFFEGVIRDAASGNGLANVAIKGVFRNTVVIDQRSGVDGKFNIGTTLSGAIEFTFSKQDYRTETVIIDLVNGELAERSLNLLPTGVSISSTDFSGCAPHEVTFSTVGAPIEQFQWTFEGGTPASSTEANPTIIFEKEGSYGIQLASTFDGQPLNLQQSNLIRVTDVPTANFSFTQDRKQYTFTNLSEDADSFLWDFGTGDFEYV
ncbi:MAG: choice-of-anchor B family protein [Bacteroidota bacterium]